MFLYSEVILTYMIYNRARNHIKNVYKQTNIPSKNSRERLVYIELESVGRATAVAKGHMKYIHK